MRMKTASRNKNKHTLFLIGIALCLCLVLGGIYAYKRHTHNLLLIQQKHEAAEQKAKEEREKHKAEIQALFDAYLNAFANDLLEKTKTYKKTRKLINSLIRPANYSDTESAKENYVLFKESLAPALRKQSSEIMSIFEQYSNKIKNELAGNDNELQKIFLSQWEDMARAQIAHYVDFFAREEELLQACEELITFYYSHSKRYEINRMGTAFEFSNPEDEEKAELLLKHVKELQKSPKTIKAEEKETENNGSE